MKNCIIACTSTTLNHIVGLAVRTQDPTMILHEAVGYDAIFKFLNNTDEQTFLFVEHTALGINIEARLRDIFMKNRMIRVCCVVLGMCEINYGIRLLRSCIDSIICDVLGGSTFTQTVQLVFKGIKHYPKHIIDALDRREDILNPHCNGSFTAREEMILETMIQGKSIKETSQVFKCSVGTISNTRKRIMGKLGAQNNVDVIRYAYERGIYTKEEQKDVSKNEKRV